MNVCLTNCDHVVTGYQWKYTYYDDGKMKFLSSYDLIKLREKVIRKGLPWNITCNKYAIDTYKYNNELLRKHDELKKTNTRLNRTSGVKYVYKTQDRKSKQGFYWKYVNNSSKGEQKSYAGRTLLSLKERVTSEGLPWIIVNQELYDSLLEKEKD